MVLLARRRGRWTFRTQLCTAVICLCSCRSRHEHIIMGVKPSHEPVLNSQHARQREHSLCVNSVSVYMSSSPPSPVALKWYSSLPRNGSLSAASLQDCNVSSEKQISSRPVLSSYYPHRWVISPAVTITFKSWSVLICAYLTLSSMLKMADGGFRNAASALPALSDILSWRRPDLLPLHSVTVCGKAPQPCSLWLSGKLNLTSFDPYTVYVCLWVFPTLHFF